MKHTHAHVRSKSHHFSVTPKSLRGTADFIDAERKKKKGGALVSEGGVLAGWRAASLSSSIAMPTVSSVVPSSSCQEAVIELTFQSGSFNEALRLASNAGQTCTRYTTLYGGSAPL